MIIKDLETIAIANEIFEGTGIKFTVSGERYLGAVIGSKKFREEYVINKVNAWIQDVEQVAKIAIDEPAYTKALCMRWCFLQRTVPNIKNFAPLEESIREKLIPAIVGKQVTDVERNILSLTLLYLSWAGVYHSWASVYVI